MAETDAAGQGGENAGLDGAALVEEVAELVLESVKAGRLYIHTHADAQQYVRNRFNRIDKAFEALGG